MAYVIEDGIILEITPKEATVRVNDGLIYQCGDARSCTPDTYHLDNDFLAAFDYKAERAMDELERRIAEGMGA